MKKKSFIILILIFIVVEIIALVMLNLESFKKDEKTEKINLDINSELVQKLYKMANPSEDAELLNDLYNNKELTNNYIVAIGVADYLKDNDPILIENPSYVFDYIPGDDVDKHIKFVLGNIDYKPQDVFLFSNGYCGFDYNEELNRYEDKGGCGSSGYEKYYRKIDSAYKEGDRIYINEKSFFVYDDWNDYISKVSIFSNYDKKNLLDYFEQDSNEALNIDTNKYMDKGSIYQYEFVQKDNNNNYIFKGIKRVE